jgi:hypothetical protein
MDELTMFAFSILAATYRLPFGADRGVSRDRAILRYGFIARRYPNSE